MLVIRLSRPNMLFTGFRVRTEHFGCQNGPAEHRSESINWFSALDGEGVG